MDNILRFLGIAKKAGKLALGEEPVAIAAKTETCFLIVVAEDAAENTKRRASQMSQIKVIPFFTLPYTKEELGQATGRASLAVLAFTDIGFARAITEKLLGIYDAAAYQEARVILERKAISNQQKRSKTKI